MLLTLAACAGDEITRPDPVVPGADAGTEVTDAFPDAPVAVWSDAEKCENMCQAYCVHKSMCDGSSVDACRMTLDEENGGTCQQRAGLFDEVPQSQVQACIDAIAAMSCPAFLHLYDTGEGMPPPCDGILI